MGSDNVSLHLVKILAGISPSGVDEYGSSSLMASEISLAENCMWSSSLTGAGFNPARLSSMLASFGSLNTFTYWAWRSSAFSLGSVCSRPSLSLMGDTEDLTFANFFA